LTGKNKTDFGHGQGRYITFLNVLNNTQISPNILEAVNVSPDEKQNAVQKGDLFFNTSSETPEEVGMCAMLDTDLPGTYLNSFCFGFRLRNSFANSLLPLYLVHLFNGEYGRKIMSVLAQGATRYNLSKEQFLATTISVPNIQIQQNVVNALSEIENSIVSTQKLIAKYEALKKATVKKLMTPGEGWKKIPLGEIGEIAMCKRILKSQTSEYGDIPFYKIGTFGKTPDAFISRELFDEYKHHFSYPNKGDVLLSAAGTIGRTVVFNGEDAYFQDSNIVWIINDEKIVYNSFLHMIYSQITWHTENGGTVSRLYNANIRDTVVAVPQKDEQKRIVSILDILNKKISLLSDQLKKTMNIKQAMLQYFFSD